MERVQEEMKRRLFVSFLTVFIILSMLAVFGIIGLHRTVTDFAYNVNSH